MRDLLLKILEADSPWSAANALSNLLAELEQSFRDVECEDKKPWFLLADTMSVADYWVSKLATEFDNHKFWTENRPTRRTV